MALFQLLLLLFYVAMGEAMKDATEDVFADTEYGRLAGFRAKTAIDGKEVSVFLGVPFAKPPINELRFEKPIPPKPWKGVRDAKEFAPACVPMFMAVLKNNSKEDCLYLNVIAPLWKSADKDHFPVMVFVHGGGYEVGSAIDYGYNFFADHYVTRNLVVVTIQYRVGPLGFAATGDESFPGNYGLWDQTMALKFVRANIDTFGGNPKMITVWGHSAGGSSVGQLTVSIHSQGLFERAIQSSGSSFAEWTLSNRVITETERLAALLNCDLSDSKKLKKCLKQKSFYEIIEAEAKTPPRSDLNFIKYAPRLDSDFFTADLATLIESARPRPMLFGVTESEGALFTMFPFSILRDIAVDEPQFGAYDRQKFVDFVRKAIVSERIFGAQMTTEVERRILDFYVDNAIAYTPEEKKHRTLKDHIFYLAQYSKLVSDLMFVVPMLIELRHKLDGGWPTYLYLSEYFNREMYPPKIPIKVATHSSEFQYVFGLSLINPMSEQLSAAELRFQRNFIDMIVGFATIGDPTPRSLADVGRRWPACSRKAPFVHLRFRDDGSAEVQEYPSKLADALKFWQKMRTDYSFDLVLGIDKHTLRSRDEL